MPKGLFFVLACIVCVEVTAASDTVELKDKAAVIGRILAEKRDQVAVDVGYTVLVIPRNQIAKIRKGEEPAANNSNTKVAARNRAATLAQPQVDVDAEASASVSPELSPERKNAFYASPGSPGANRTVRELVQQLGEGVVQVRTPSGLGSGFFINEDGFLITNFHVIEGETQISVEVYNQSSGQLERRTYKQVRIVAMNKFADLALLKVDDKDAVKFKFVSLGSSDLMSVGESVFAIGSPLGLERTVTEGILSTKTRQLGGELYLQTTAQINPGNSGGPLFSLSGEVVGVINMKVTFGEGIGFAIPVEAVRFFLDHRDSFAYSNDNPSNAYRYLEPPSRTRSPTILQRND
jgi:serine protease Do